jgi:hypothetical protein
MAHVQKPDLVFRRYGRVHLNRRGRQFSRLLAAEVCASAVVMLDTTCSEVVRRVLATHSIPQFPFHFPSSASPCAITFQLESASTAQGRQMQLWSVNVCCLSGGTIYSADVQYYRIFSKYNRYAILQIVFFYLGVVNTLYNYFVRSVARYIPFIYCYT